MSYIPNEWEVGDYVTKDKMNNIENGISVLDTTKEALNNKTFDINEASTDDEYPSAKAVWDLMCKVPGFGPGGGGTSKSPSDVTFYDYEGTVVESYTANEFLALNAMPANPSHSGLIAQGWNWSFEDARDYVNKYGKLNVGQMYITDDGTTRIYVHMSKKTLNPMLCISLDGTVDVDWGDGTAHDTLIGTSLTELVHTDNHVYTKSGDYVIKLTVITGEMNFFGHASESYGDHSLLLCDSPDITREHKNNLYPLTIHKIEMGHNLLGMGNGALSDCRNLESITISNELVSLYKCPFVGCDNFLGLTLPNNINLSDDSIGEGNNRKYIAFPNKVSPSYCPFLATLGKIMSITIPESITSMYFTCYGYSKLSNIIIPDTVTEIYDSIVDLPFLEDFIIPNNVTNIKSSFRRIPMLELHVQPLVPPTMNSETFDGTTFTSIYVPQGCLEAYQTAENWSNYASYMQEEPN